MKSRKGSKTNGHQDQSAHKGNTQEYTQRKHSIKHPKKTQRKHPLDLVLKGHPKRRHRRRRNRKRSTVPPTGFLSLACQYTYAAEVIVVAAVASNLCSSQHSHVDLLLTNKWQTKLGSWHNQNAQMVEKNAHLNQTIQNNVPAVHFRICNIIYLLASYMCAQIRVWSGLVTDNFGLFTEIAVCKLLHGWQSYGLKLSFLLRCMCLYIFPQLFVRRIVPKILLGIMCHRNVHHYYCY